MINRWRQWRQTRTLKNRAIPDELWNLTLARHSFLTWRPVADQQRLRELATLFVADKEFAGMQGLEVTDEMAVVIAAQACLPILNLGLEWYDGFKGIVVHPDAVRAYREHTDDDGVVHQYHEELSGEAMSGGPVMLSWHDVAQADTSAQWGYNVVIHEFVHVLDLRDGTADGIPPLADRRSREHWQETLEQDYTAFCTSLEAGCETLLDPYGAESIDEFFAVASEAFFVAPGDLADAYPRTYALLSGFYHQDTLPAQEHALNRAARAAQNG